MIGPFKSLFLYRFIWNSFLFGNMQVFMLDSAQTVFFFFNNPPTPEIYTLSLHDALPIFARRLLGADQGDEEGRRQDQGRAGAVPRSEEHTSELQSPDHLVCRLLLEK